MHRTLPPTTTIRSTGILMETEAVHAQHRDELVRSLKQFSLSYQQHQLIHSSDFGPLVSDIQSKRRVFTILLAILALFLTFKTVRGLLTSSPYLHWLVLAVLTGLWVFRRYAKMSRLVSAYGDYLGTAGEAARRGNSLASELKLGFNLDYPEHQVPTGRHEFGAAADSCRPVEAWCGWISRNHGLAPMATIRRPFGTKNESPRWGFRNPLGAPVP